MTLQLVRNELSSLKHYKYRKKKKLFSESLFALILSKNVLFVSIKLFPVNR